MIVLSQFQIGADEIDLAQNKDITTPPPALVANQFILPRLICSDFNHVKMIPLLQLESRQCFRQPNIKGKFCWYIFIAKPYYEFALVKYF